VSTKLPGAGRWIAAASLGVGLSLAAGPAPAAAADLSVKGLHDKAEQVLDKAGGTLIEKKRKYERETSERLDRLRRRFRDHERRAGHQGGAEKARFERHAPDVEKSLDKAKGKLDALKSKAGDAWEKAKGGVEDAVRKAERSVDDAFSGD